MKIPSEAELIEMERKFDFLLEISYEMRGQAREARQNLLFANAKELDGDAEILEAVNEMTSALVELIRHAR